MNSIESILSKINVDDRLINLYNNTSYFPSYIDRFDKFDSVWYPHPPALIPVFVDHGGPVLNGILHHHFFSREYTYIRYDLESKCFVEYCLNFDQFIARLIISQYEIELEDSDDFKNFIKLVEFEFYDSMIESLDNTDYTNDYSLLPTFAEKRPLSLEKNVNDYAGTFLSGFNNMKYITLFNKQFLNVSCGYELNDISLLNDVDAVPEWFKPTVNKKELFDNYFRDGHLDKAWLSLNSTGWNLKDVEESLLRLKSKTDNELFHLVADNWIEGKRNSQFEDDFEY